ncbi:hypothetical protein SRABI96_02419 [Peribacillus sp. Bi96]|nr:hypothetical protein SRABI96_02419 [Peribacillus sp. Bi96]
MKGECSASRFSRYGDEDKGVGSPKENPPSLVVDIGIGFIMKIMCFFNILKVSS